MIVKNGETIQDLLVDFMDLEPEKAFQFKTIKSFNLFEAQTLINNLRFSEEIDGSILIEPVEGSGGGMFLASCNLPKIEVYEINFN